ncbi:MAG TPA: hypothetical protein VF503_25860 [Sphingobium sp.]|uniref:hypothetical protein n=1 Tax=Sphingobium sp. TaxID=1912891 RepID=UPI002ED551E7
MDESAKQRTRWTELLVEGIAALVLSIAALLTSWASFQAALWDGEQAAAYTQAGAARVRAGLLATENGQVEAVDMFLFTQWLNARAEGKNKLEAFYRARFRPEFSKQFEHWLTFHPEDNPAAPPTPFAVKGYRTHFAVEAQWMDKKADALFDKGQRANSISDAFVRATVILAIALFLGGIGQTFKRHFARFLLSGLACLACIVGLLSLTSLPKLAL